MEPTDYIPEDRLGRYEGEGEARHAVWPAHDLNGAPYTRPPQTLGIGADYFVVIPPGVASQAAEGLLQVWQASATEKAKVKRPVRASEATDDETD